jgi:hypothetical protein
MRFEPLTDDMGNTFRVSFRSAAVLSPQGGEVLASGLAVCESDRSKRPTLAGEGKKKGAYFGSGK